MSETEQHIPRWDDIYLVGIDKFDAQHKRFFQLLEQLVCSKKDGSESVKIVIDGLLNYVTEHFHEEEQMMFAHGFPGYEEHLKEHEKLLCKTQALYSDMDMGRPASVEQVQRILVEWIQKHIITIDQKYAAYFRERGIEE